MFQYPNYRVPKGEEQQQEIENLFEQIMKENFLNLAKEKRLPRSPRSSESPKEVGPRRNTSRHIIIALTRLKTRRES